MTTTTHWIGCASCFLLLASYANPGPPEFEITYREDGEFRVHVGRISRQGLLRVHLDGKLALEQPLPLGPVHLAWADVVVAAVVLLLAHHTIIGYPVFLLSFLFAFLGLLGLTFWWTGPWPYGYAIAFGVALVVLGIQIFSIGLVGEIIIFTQAKNLKEYRVSDMMESRDEGEGNP